jgi:hypothetical protein
MFTICYTAYNKGIVYMLPFLVRVSPFVHQNTNLKQEQTLTQH